MDNTTRRGAVGSFSRGFAYPFQAWRFIRHHPVLLRYILVPFAINLTLFISLVSWGYQLFDRLLGHWLPQGEAWYWAFLSYFVWTMALLVTLVIVFFAFTAIGNLIASPFNDLLSERTEELLRGNRQEEAFSFRLLWHDALRTLVQEGKKIGLFVAGMLLLLPLNLLPGLGSVLYSVLSFFWTVFFLVVEYTGYVFSRHRLSFRQQRRLILSRRLLFLGFGVGSLCLLAVPLLQFFCIPFAVVGATRLCVEEELELAATTPEG